ncbi:EamA family transporter [Entomomonas sp. E2T0]|uniref:EamA family transporter n=1 Tax=Entomomonas sp. E2T0 TaxID=2930213 RepID=UPI0022284E3D|nr:EamA family transporter [Entomomonas sp. E2T0]UYZ84255.1 EamA family transporter [Entomomonas sp. E2T0]
MPLRHLMLIFIVILSWGFSFVATKLGLLSVPPLLFGALRFATLIIPALFFPLPKIKFSWLIIYGMVMCFGQFTFLFTAIYFGMPAGLASLVMQSQAFFTIIMGAFILKEFIRPQTLLGLAIAVIGLIIIGYDAGTNATLIGLLLTLCAGLSWATGNILIKKLQPVNTLHLTIWGGVVSVIPLIACSIIFEGVTTIKDSILNINLTTILSVLYLGFIATLLAYGLWAQMLSRYAASIVAPFSLLVPIIGMSSSAWFLNEHLTTLEIIGSIAVMIGLCVNVFGYRLFFFFKRPQ